MRVESSSKRVCVLCGRDCAGRPRVKDRRGRYYCEPCHERALAARRAGPGPGTPAPPEAPSPPEATPAPEALYGGGLQPCPGCGELLGGETVVCHRCGFHRGLGRRLETESPAEPGPAAPPLRTPMRHRRLEADSRAIARREYLRPCLMFTVGAGLIFLIQAWLAGPLSGAAYLLTYLFSVPAGVAVFWLCSLLWIGFDAPLHLTALRLAGIYAMADLALFVPIPVFGWALSMLIYIGLLMEMLELDLADALGVAIATFFVKLLLIVFLATWLVEFLG